MNTVFRGQAQVATSKRATLRQLAALSALFVGAALQSQGAQAAGTQFALTCIGTETTSAINFQYRWGPSGEWRSARATPGNWQAISYRYSYEGENRAPRLELRFDDDMSSEVNMVRQKLSSYAARTTDCEGEGFTYNFVTRRGELFLVPDESRSGGTSL